MKGKRRNFRSPAPYFSPGELVERWRCARATVDRIARRAGLKRLYLGEGKEWNCSLFEKGGRGL